MARALSIMGPLTTVRGALLQQGMGVLDQAAVSGCTFGTTAILARLAGLEELGTFAVAWMTVLLVNAVQHAFVSAPMASLVPTADEHAEGFFGYFVGAQRRALLLLTALWLVASAGAVVATPSLAPLIAAAGFANLAYQAADFVRRYAHSRNRPMAAVTLSVTSSLLQLTGMLLVGVAGLLTATTALLVVATGVLVVLLPVAAYTIARPVPHPTDRALAARHWQSARWLLPSALMQWTSGNLFVLLAPTFVGVAGAGALRTAQSIAGVANLLTFGLENVLPAHAGRLWRSRGSNAAMRCIAGAALRWGLVMAVLIGLLELFAEPLLRAIHGAEAARYAWVLRAYGALQLLVFAGVPLRALLRAAEETQGIFVAFAAASLFSIVSVFPLLRWASLAGAMAGIVGAQVVFQSVLAMCVWRCCRLSPDSATMTVSLASVSRGPL